MSLCVYSGQSAHVQTDQSIDTKSYKLMDFHAPWLHGFSILHTHCAMLIFLLIICFPLVHLMTN